MPIIGGVDVPERAVLRDQATGRIIKLRLQPAQPGTVVRDDETGRLLEAAGALVANTTYWRRRLTDGSAVPSPLEPPKARQKDAEASEE